MIEQAIEQIKAVAEREYFPWVVEECVIETPEQLKNASDLLAVGKRLEKDAESKLAEITKPIRAQEQAARDAFRPLISRIRLGWSRIDDAIIKYHRRIKAEADALLQIQMLEQAQKIVEARETGEIIDTEQQITAPVGQTVRGNMGSTRIAETFEYEIIDDDAIPRGLCSGDLKKIKAKHKYDKLPIPGVLITVKTHTISRFS